MKSQHTEPFESEKQNEAPNSPLRGKLDKIISLTKFVVNINPTSRTEATQKKNQIETDFLKEASSLNEQSKLE